MVFLVCLLSAAVQAEFMPKLVNGSAPYTIRSFRNSTVYGIKADGYARDILLIDLHAATRYDMGYDYGFLLANESYTNWNALISSLGLSRLEQDIIFQFLDSEWRNHLSVQARDSASCSELT